MKLIVVCMMMVISLSFGKIATYSTQVDAIYTIAPAKSAKIVCKTRVDLSKGLVDNGVCGLNEIQVYNRDNFWVGSLDDQIDAYEARRYYDYDTERYKYEGHHIVADYVSMTEDANDDNIGLARCPAGMIKFAADGFAQCKKPYACDDGEYAIDQLLCEELPLNSHRNKSSGFSCNKGFVKQNGECEQKTICDGGDLYNADDNSCLFLPDNAQWIKNSKEWKCKLGYIELNGSCEEKAVCDSTSRYESDTNVCVELPENAVWADSESTRWSCKWGYIERDGSRCEEKSICTSEQRYDAETNICLDPFPHSKWVGVSNEYICDSGYVNVGYGQCEEKAHCEHYNSKNNSCFEKPEHAHWRYEFGDAWECDYEYWNTGDDCVERVKCDGSARYKDDENRCIPLPEHAHWQYEYGDEWECDAGYWNTGYFCEEKASCGVFERYNEDHNVCVTKPAHTHWTYDWYYTCDDGYSWDYSGMECYETNPTNLSDYLHFAHDIGMDIGFGNLKDKFNNVQTMFTMSIDYDIGIRVGTDNFSIRSQFTLGLLYTHVQYTTEQYDIMPEDISSTLFMYGLNFGLDVWKLSSDYSVLWTKQETLHNITYNNMMHKVRVGYSLNEHWRIHLAIIPNVISASTIMSSYNTTWYHLGVTYRF